MPQAAAAFLAISTRCFPARRRGHADRRPAPGAPRALAVESAHAGQLHLLQARTVHVDRRHRGQAGRQLYFAGEHANSFYEWQGFMEGAARSGIDAAEAIFKVSKRSQQNSVQRVRDNGACRPNPTQTTSRRRVCRAQPSRFGTTCRPD